MTEVDDNSSTTTINAPSCKIWWFCWKGFLERFYTVQNSLQLTKFHGFRFHRNVPEVVQIKHFSSSSDFNSFPLVEKNVTAAEVRSATESTLLSNEFKAVITPLEDVPSAHEGNRMA